MPDISLSTRVMDRLKGFAEPFVDTPESVIERALNALENSEKGERSTGGQSGIVDYDPRSPPSLTHTKVLAIEIDGAAYPHKGLYWNYLMSDLVLRAHASGMSAERIRQTMTAQTVAGRKEDEGYKFVPEIGISIQGQDSIGAWRNIAKLASALNLDVTVEFMWLENPKAAHPGKKGRFQILSL